MIEDSEGENVQVAVQYPADVRNRLTLAEPDLVLLEDHGVGAQIDRRDLARDPGPGRGLLEEQAYLAAGQPPCISARVRFCISRNPQHLSQTVGTEVGHHQVVVAHQASLLLRNAVGTPLATAAA